MSDYRIAGRYATSLFDLALEQNALEEIKEDATLITTLFKENRLLALTIASPVVSAQKKQSILTQVLGGNNHKVTLALITLMIRKKREDVIGSTFSRFLEMYREREGIIDAQVSTAYQASQATLDGIRNMLEAKTGKKVELTAILQPELVGGFVVRYGDKLIDASVRTQLKTLHKHLLHTN